MAAVAAPSGVAILTNAGYKDHLNVIKGFCDKADGKDKLTALIQYACMFISAGEPGNVKKIQASVTAARKIFRVMRPLEMMIPIINQPGFSGSQPTALQAINKLKTVLMAIYFGADHFVWAFQIGLITNKQAGERWQKVSLYSWMLGSLCTVAAEVFSMSQERLQRKEGETDAEFAARSEAAAKKLRQRELVLGHALVQAALAAGLLQLRPMKPRTVGFLGIVASAINCYFLMPDYPKLAAKAKAA